MMVLFSPSCSVVRRAELTLLSFLVSAAVLLIVTSYEGPLEPGLLGRRNSAISIKAVPVGNDCRMSRLSGEDGGDIDMTGISIASLWVERR